MNNYHLLIEKVTQACINKNAFIFASLFSQDGIIILSKNNIINRADIEKITHDYFSVLKYINIEIHSIIIEKNKAFIEWSWSDYNLKTNSEKSQDNVIVLEFKQDLIYRWREYKG
ncbi:hypothetical protein [Geminocystis sp. NIES-3709]|uniref:hypothetical protein n=1 Tax=Geminocystis sp. NIES-3709 TaxID=1617448 RepID=UPI0005FC6ACA|nr:hypothetical protein [Geminocystis sp. NIES-3709]BAQ65026.1 hypothetical protein GM3709_1791 [Geminocystis sp. NIES-3709]